jgi:hypothetical protein
VAKALPTVIKFNNVVGANAEAGLIIFQSLKQKNGGNFREKQAQSEKDPNRSHLLVSYLVWSLE